MKDQPLQTPFKQEKDTQKSAGWLVLRIKPGEGVVLGGEVEIRIASVNNRTQGDVKVAIRAPKALEIRRVR